MKNTNKILLSITIILCYIGGIPFNAEAAVGMSDYTSVPPFVSDIVEPNVMILQSNGATMLNPAYCAAQNIRTFGHIEGGKWKPKGIFCTEDMESRPTPPSVSGSDDAWTGAQLTDLSMLKGNEINPASDADYYMFYAAAGTTYTLAVSAAGSGTGSLSDSYLYLYSTDGTTLITEDDDAGPGLDSLISAWTPTVSGYYYAKVESYYSSYTGTYSLKITPSTSSWGAGYSSTTDYYGFFKADAPDDADASADTRYMTTTGSGAYLASSGNDAKYFRIDGADGLGTHADSLTWSGNFLNWLTMRRIDTARKALIGGRGKCEKPKCESVLDLSASPSGANAGPSFLVGTASDFPKTLTNYRTQTGNANAIWYHEPEKTSKTKTEDGGYRIVRYVREKAVGDPDVSPYTAGKACYGVKDAKLYERTVVTPIVGLDNPVEYCHLSETTTDTCYNSDGSSETCAKGTLYDMDRDGAANEYVTNNNSATGAGGSGWAFREREDEDDEGKYGSCTDAQVEACEDADKNIYYNPDVPGDPLNCTCTNIADKHKLRVWVDTVETSDLGIVQKTADKIRFGLGFFRKDDKVPAKNDGAEVLVPVDFYNNKVTVFSKDKAFYVPHITALTHQIMGLKLKDDPAVTGNKIIEDKDAKPKSWSPLAEGLWTVVGYFQQSSTNTAASCANSVSLSYTYGATTYTYPAEGDPCGPHYYDVSKGQPATQFSYYWAYQYGNYTGAWNNPGAAPAVSGWAYYYNFDPYYFTRDYNNDGILQSTEKDKPAPCCKSFVLMVTDANSSYDQNVPSTQRTALDGNVDAPTCPPFPYRDKYDNTSKPENNPYASCGSGFLDDVAYWANINDLRNPDPGAVTNTTKQTLTTYILYAFGAGSSLVKDAAKYGGFDDSNSNNLPDLASEWDTDGNSVPDTYFEAQTAQDLPNKLLQAIESILKQSASGTSVSVLATSAEGEGALYQAYFYPRKILSDFSERTWLGYTRGLFLDSYGNLREDTDANGRLTLLDDYIVRMEFDAVTYEVKAKRYKDTKENGEATTYISQVSLDNIKPIWEAGKILAARTTSRNVYTWLPGGAGSGPTTDGFISRTGTAVDFSTANNVTLQPYLRAASSGESTNLISYIRGSDITGYRDRELDDGNTWRLGDIVYSTPTVVASPKEQYDIIYGSHAGVYSDFRKKYKDRRQIVYVGANDGMLHAFNAGVYKAGNDPATAGVTEHGWFTANPSSGDGWGAALGDELWAFTPYETLPHLAWLTCDQGAANPAACGGAKYGHTFYVDLKPKVTDVRIFCDSVGSLSPPASPDCVAGQGGGAGTSHPGGWGTILIMGMRLGGGSMGVDLSSPADADAADAGEAFKSAYYVFDITDPEQKPVLLWRFTDADMGFTTGFPSIAHISGSPEKWFMVIGSGPTNTNPPTTTPPMPGTMSYTGTSSQNGRIFIFDLVGGTNSITFTRLGVNNDAAKDLINSTGATPGYGFMGDASVVDGNLDYTSDIIYIGSAYSTTSGGMANKGRLYRINTKGSTIPAEWELSLMFDQDRPLLVGPSVTKDKNTDSLWVFFGTGRLWTTDDKQTTDTQSIYGIRDACWKYDSAAIPTHCTTTYTKASDLLNVTDVVVKQGAAATVTSAALSMADACYFGGSSCLLERVRAKQGWFINLPLSRERVLSKSSILGGVLLASSFVPNTDICSFQGDSYLYALYYETGAAYIKPVIGTETISGVDYISKSISLGKGMPTTVGIGIGQSARGYVQTSTGTIVELDIEPALSVKSGPAGWREKTGGGGTVDIEEIYKHIVK